MSARTLPRVAVLAATVAAAAGCSHTLESLCEDCGVIRKITPRTVAGDALMEAARPGRLVSSSPAGLHEGGCGNRTAPRTVYIVAVRMDWGGTSYFTVGSVDGFQPGDRVEIRYGEMVPIRPASQAMP